MVTLCLVPKVITEAEFQVAFAKRLRHARVEAGYKSAAALARALGINVHTYRRYENLDPAENRAFPPHIMPLLCALLRTTADYLILGETPKITASAPPDTPAKAG